MPEEVIYYKQPYAKYGIISYPEVREKDLPLVIFLNAGLVNRQGPNRLYVKMARGLNVLGFTCFRFDLPGIGDNVNTYTVTTKYQMYAMELESVLNHLRQSTGFRSFVLCGMCTGADLAYEYGQGDGSIRGICMINSTSSLTNKSYHANINYRYYRKYITDVRRWLKFLTIDKFLKIPKYGSMVIFYFLYKIKKSISVKQKDKVGMEASGTNNLEVVERWMRLLTSDVEVIQVIAEGSESFDNVSNFDKAILDFNASRANYEEHIIYDADHTFTSILSQQDLISKVIGWCRARFIGKSSPLESCMLRKSSKVHNEL